MPIQPDQTGNESVLDQIESTQGKVYLVNRLDRPVSGVVIFAKTKKSAAQLSEMLQKGQLIKKYLAAVQNKPKQEEGELIHYLNKRNFKTFVSKNPKNGKLAKLKYKLVGQSDHYSFLEIDLITGRFHQIRAQLAAMGCPVKGDVKYGARRANRDRSIHLHALSIEFINPMNNKKLILSAELPQDPVWAAFKK